MDTLIQESLTDFNVTSPISNAELIVALLATALFIFILAKVYIYTHSGYSYSKSYVHTLVLTGITVALIMMIIGSNIARAFALVGAMSIIRFRNPVKDSRDLVFIFMAIAIGMACGTKFYLFAGIFTVFTCGLVMMFELWGFGDLPTKGYVMKIRIKSEERKQLTELFDRYCEQYSLVTIDRLRDGDGYEDLMYEIELKQKADYDQFVETITTGVPNASISLLVGESNVNA